MDKYFLEEIETIAIKKNNKIVNTYTLDVLEVKKALKNLHDLFESNKDSEFHINVKGSNYASYIEKCIFLDGDNIFINNKKIINNLDECLYLANKEAKEYRDKMIKLLEEIKQIDEDNENDEDDYYDEDDEDFYSYDNNDNYEKKELLKEYGICKNKKDFIYSLKDMILLHLKEKNLCTVEGYHIFNDRSRLLVNYKDYNFHVNWSFDKKDYVELGSIDNFIDKEKKHKSEREYFYFEKLINYVENNISDKKIDIDYLVKVENYITLFSTENVLTYDYDSRKNYDINDDDLCYYSNGVETIYKRHVYEDHFYRDWECTNDIEYLNYELLNLSNNGIKAILTIGVNSYHYGNLNFE